MPSTATIVSAVIILLAFSAAFYFANTNHWSVLIGLPLILVGIFVRVVTNSTLTKNQSVYRDGLYKICRHPMYVGSLALAIGITVALNNLAAVLLLTVVLAISFYRVRKEEAFLVSKFPDYETYRAHVPMFPTPNSVFQAVRGNQLKLQMSLDQCFKNGEVLRLNLYLPLILAAGLYLYRQGRLDIDLWIYTSIATLLLAFSIFSLIRQPEGSSRSRFDFLLPVALNLIILVLSVISRKF